MPVLNDLDARVDTASFAPEAVGMSNPTALPCALAVYVRVYCSAASTLPGSGVQVTLSWTDPAGTPQEHDTIISLDILGNSSIPEIFLASLPTNGPVLLSATEVGDGEFTVEYGIGTLMAFYN